jgi:hypothetical protein
MRREVRFLVTILALLLSSLRSFAASPSKKPAVDLGATISDALCGRGTGFRAKLAKALDTFDRMSVPPIWQEAEVSNLRPWLDAPVCSGASEAEGKLYSFRHLWLERLGHRLKRAQAMEQIGSALAQFRGLRPGSEEWWLSSADCAVCAALRASAARVADIASRWPTRTSSKVGVGLSAAAKREMLIEELCAAMPPPRTRAEIEEGFRYYSWTVGGAKLFEVAALFEQPEIAAECRGR